MMMGDIVFFLYIFQQKNKGFPKKNEFYLLEMTIKLNTASNTSRIRPAKILRIIIIIMIFIIIIIDFSEKLFSNYFHKEFHYFIM
jgi:hypothetical protein